MQTFWFCVGLLTEGLLRLWERLQDAWWRWGDDD
jgi:hypothetical protein